MAHEYNPLTTPATSYTEVSPIRPVGDAEEQFTWDNINTIWDTWKEFTLLGKLHWVDWWYGDAYVDNYTSLTTPAYSYSGLTKSDNTYSTITTPSQTYKEVTK